MSNPTPKHPVHGHIGDLNGFDPLGRPRTRAEEVFAVEIGKMSPQPGDLVIVRMPDAVDAQVLTSIREALKSALPPGVKWLGLLGGYDLQHVTADEMAAMGWVGIEPVRRLVLAARTTGGVPGGDDELCAALDAVEALLPMTAAEASEKMEDVVPDSPTDSKSPG